MKIKTPPTLFKRITTKNIITGLIVMAASLSATQVSARQIFDRGWIDLDCGWSSCTYRLSTRMTEAIEEHGAAVAFTGGSACVAGALAPPAALVCGALVITAGSGRFLAAVALEQDKCLGVGAGLYSGPVFVDCLNW